MGVPPQIELGNLGMADSLILMVLALVVFGPRRLPQIGRQIGKLMYEFRKASNDFKFQMEEELRAAEDADRRKKEEEERARNLALNPPAPVVEAQAAVGADDQASVSAQPPTLGAGSPYPAEYPAETAVVSPVPEQQIRYPRINPPSTGEPVAAARPNYYFEPSDHATDPVPAPELNPGAKADTHARSVEVEADLNNNESGTPAAADIDSPAPPREHISQHG